MSALPAKVLNVDDNDIGRYATSRVLRFAGFEVLEAGSGGEALSRIAAEAPQLVLLDVNLPDINGFEVCRRIKADPRTAGIPVLQISATFVQGNDRAHGLDSGADGYLTEPVEPAVLIATVNAFIRMRRAEEEVRQVALHWQAVFDSIKDGIALLDLSGIIQRCNRAFAQILGLEPERAVGCSWADLGGSNVLLERMIKSRSREATFLQKNARSFEAAMDPISDAGELSGAVCVFTDITERKRREQEIARQKRLLEEAVAFQNGIESALRESKHKIESILTSITDAFLVLDHDWRFVDLNARAETIIGKSRTELVGKVVWQLFPNAVDSALFRQFNKAVRNRIPVHLETPSESNRGRWFEVHAYPSEGGLAVYFRDITDRKQVEAERDRLLVAERKAREEAEQANNVKDEFLARVSHELRTPTNAVIGWTNLLKSGKLGPQEAARALDVIERNTKSQAQLLEDLADASRIVSGGLRLDMSTIRIDEVLSMAIETMKPSADDKEIRIVARFQQESTTLKGDPNRLRQVFWNLLSNSIKFTPRGGTIEIVEQRTDSMVEISVIDTGSGIPKEFLPRVFESFQQGAHTSSGPGLGLGLAIARTIVELHHGSIAAFSAGEGKGTRFTVSLPA